MVLYYFHLRDGVDVILDPEGRELADTASVRAMALRDARSIISDDARQGVIKLDQRIDVEDAARVVVHRLKFTDAVLIIYPEAA